MDSSRELPPSFKALADNLAQEVADRTNAIATEKSRAEGVESDHESRIATMEAFFKEAYIDASKDFIDTLKEIQSYIASDKTGAAAMTASIEEIPYAVLHKITNRIINGMSYHFKIQVVCYFYYLGMTA